MVPGLQRTQVPNLRAVGIAKVFTGQQHRNSRWVRDHGVCRNTSRQIFNRHHLNVVTDYRVVSVTRSNIRIRQTGVGCIETAAWVVLFQPGEHGVAQIVNTHVGISVRMFLNQFWHHLCQRGIGIVVVFERAQCVDQCAPFPAGNPHGEQEHNLEIGGSGRHDAVAAKPGGNQCSRYAVLFQFAIVAHPRCQNADFDRVQHAPVIRQVFKAVPGFTRTHHPAVLIGCQQCGWRVGKVIGFTGLRIGYHFFVPRFEEPVAFGGKLFVQPCHGLTEIDCFVDHFLSERQAAVTVHHGDRHVV